MFQKRTLCLKNIVLLVQNSLVYANLNYCNSLWSFYFKSFPNPVIIMQKEIIRATTGVCATSKTGLILEEWSLLKKVGVNIYMTYIFVYKFLAGIIYRKLFKTYGSSYDTRRNRQCLLNMSQIRNHQSEQCIKYYLVMVWIYIRETPFNVFKRKLKFYLINLNQLLRNFDFSSLCCFKISHLILALLK